MPLKDVLLDELRDMYSAENQLVKALPKLAKSSTSAELRNAFESHLEETKGHVERLEKIFEQLGTSPGGKTCKAMKGLIEEGSEMMDEDAEPSIMDAGLIAAAQRWSTMRWQDMGSCARSRNCSGTMKRRGCCRRRLKKRGRRIRS